MDARDMRIVVETARQRITGTLSLPSEGYRSRLTDYLNAAERAFIALTDVEVVNLDGPSRSERRSFVAVSLQAVVLAMPADGDPGERTASTT